MNRRALAAALFVVIAVIARPVTAQSAAPLLGKWSIEYERGRRVENDVVTPVMDKGVLTITSRGDSLAIVLEAGPRPDGSPSAPVTFVGHLSAAGAVFVQTRQVRLMENGEASTREIKLTWTVKADGDVLAGTIATDMPNAPMPMLPSPIKGSRLKA